MILFWFLSRELACVFRALYTRLGVRACHREATALLRQLGRKAWELRKQHVGMDDILAKLEELETEGQQLQRTVDAIEQEVRTQYRPKRAQVQQLAEGRNRLARLQREMSKNWLLLGKAIDASRHHDAALVEFYDRLDECSGRREHDRRHLKVLRLSFIKTAPLALAELAIVVLLTGYAIRAVRPVLVDYHTVFSDDFKDANGGWRLTGPQTGSLAVGGGILTLRSTKVSAAALPKLGKVFRDVHVRARVRAPAIGSVCGLVLRYADGCYHILEYQGDRSCCLSLCRDGRRSMICDWRAPSGISLDSDEFNLEVHAKGDEISAYVDGQRVIFQRSLSASPGQFGFCVPADTELKALRFEVLARGLAAWLHRRGQNDPQ